MNTVKIYEIYKGGSVGTIFSLTPDKDLVDGGFDIGGEDYCIPNGFIISETSYGEKMFYQEVPSDKRDNPAYTDWPWYLENIKGQPWLVMHDRDVRNPKSGFLPLAKASSKKRTVVFLTQEQNRQLKQIALDHNTSVSALLEKAAQEIIQKYLDGE